MGCILCNKKYIGKAERSFHINLNGRKDIRKGNTIITSNYLKQESHNLNKHAKFTMTDQLTLPNVKNFSPKRENVWVLKLNMLYPKQFQNGIQ